MVVLTQADNLPSGLFERTLSITLNVKSANDIVVRSCEVLARGFRNRISFLETGALEDVLATRLASELRACLKSIPEGTRVLALPDFLVELPGLALSGVHIMITHAKDGMRSAIFRFTEFMGTINSAFLADIGFDEPYGTHSEKLAVSILQDICLPILNLSRTFEKLDFQGNRQAAQAFQDRAREFEFQTELLKRFIFNAGVDNKMPEHCETDAINADGIRHLIG